MPIFKYEAMDSQGVEIKDEIEALSEKEALSKIRNMGYFPTKVNNQGGTQKTIRRASKSRSRRGAKGGAKVKVITQFARQLSTLQDAGLPILRSLRILEEQQKRGVFKKVVGYIADDIEGGSTLSEAMARFPKCFDRLFVGMIAAGETGGVLDLILSRIADFMEKAQKLRARVKSAMVYPTVVISAAFLILLGLMKYVVPSFSLVLDEMLDGAQMNPITTVIGPLTNKISITRWTRTLGTLIGAGVPILDAINVTSETAGNEVFSRMLDHVHSSIRQGETFADPLKKSKTVDLLVTNMVAVGEETGDLDKMLLKIAEDYDEQVDVLVSSLMSLLEPIMILVLGAIVMVIVLAIFLPMIQIISGMAG